MQYFFSILKTHNIDLNLLKKLGLVVFFLFIARYLFSILVVYYFPPYDSTSNSFLTTAFQTNSDIKLNLEEIWNNWDSIWYLNIIENGYTIKPFDPTKFENWNFSPLYPMSVHLLSSVIGLNTTFLIHLLGVLLSNVFFIFGLYFFYKLMLFLNFSKVQCISTLMLFLSFPGNYFFTLNYTESLFFLLSVLSMYTLFKKQYASSILLIALAMTTRITGICLLPGFCYFFLLNEGGSFKSKMFKLVVLILISFVPLLLFYQYLNMVTGEFFANIKIANIAWDHKNDFPFIFIINSLLNITNLHYLFQKGLILLLLFVFIFILIRSTKSIIKYKELYAEYMSLFLYAFASLGIISSVNFGTSIIRYTAVVFPIFMFFIKFYSRSSYENLYFIVTLMLFSGLQVLFFAMFILSIPSSYSF